MIALLKTCRLGKVFSIIVGVFTISTYALGTVDYFRTTPMMIDLTCALVALFFLICAGYIMNDCCDIKYDAVNKPERTITRNITIITAKYAVGIMFALGLLAAFQVNIWYLLVVIVDLGILILYNLFSKKLAYLKSVIVSLLVVSIYPLSLALTSGGFPSLKRDSLFIFPMWLFFMIMAYEIMQDSIDVKGDGQDGGKTLPILVGVQKAKYIAVILAILATPVALIPYYFGMCGKIYLIGALVALPIMIGSMFFNAVVFSSGLLFYVRAVTVASLIDILWK